MARGGDRHAEALRDLGQLVALLAHRAHLVHAQVDAALALELARGVQQRGELVELEERAQRLGHLAPQLAIAGRVGVDQVAIDRLLEDRGEQADRLLSLRGPNPRRGLPRRSLTTAPLARSASSCSRSLSFSARRSRPADG